MAGNKEKYGSQPFFELKSDNGVRILKFIPDDDLCVFTTVDANIAIYEPGAGGLYLLAMLNYKDFPDQRLPLSFHVSGEKRQLFFSDSKDNLMLINFDKTSQSFAPVQLKASASTSHISQVGEFLFYLNAQAGKVECMKRSGNTYVDDKEDVPPAASGAVPIRFVSVNNEALFIEFTDGTYGLYNVAKRQYMAQGILQKIPIHWDTPIKYDRNTMSLFFQSGNEICQFHITRKAIVRRYDLEKWGQPGNYLLYKQKIVFATDKHHMIGKILGEKEECDGNVYIAASRFKLDPKFNQVYFNVKDREQVLLTNGKLIEELRITPEKDKIEEIELNPKKNQGRNTQGSGEQYRNAGKGEARSRSQRSREEEEDEERDDQTMKKKTKKKKVVKKRKRSFDLNGIHHLNKGDYNALRDEHLKSYFYSYRIRHHLIKQHMVIGRLFRSLKTDILSKIRKNLGKIKNYLGNTTKA